jgi:phosphoribosyl-ATP pyrophosphohydrolase/phosphoribosyl-AMP cyclohydrolase
MLGYMNTEALERTRTTKRVTFWSRSKQALWEKGETSGHTHHVVSITPDCDQDSLLVRVRPDGPTCHTGTRSCFGDNASVSGSTLRVLESIILDRKERPAEGSHTARLFEKGPLRIAQKVGEEAVETILASASENKKATISESADLLYHLSVLFAAKGIRWEEVEEELRGRMPK